MPSPVTKPWFPRLPSALDRAPMAGLMCAGALLLGVVLAGARSSNSAENVARTADNDKAARFHEGEELVDQVGQFQMSAGRVVFIAADGKSRFIALENLALERIAPTIDNSVVSAKWIVSGKITENRGANYLLLARAERYSESPVKQP